MQKKSIREVDALWMNWDEYIPAKNIELHSQYWTKKPQTMRGTFWNQGYNREDLELEDYNDYVKFYI